MPKNNKIPWWYTEIGEAEKHQVMAAFDNKKFSMGVITRDFETHMAAKLGARYAVACPSGTAALTMALMSAGIEPGDEVIIPALTWIATANAAAILGARVVLVDCLSDVPLIDVKEVKSKITKRTKAIIPVHLNGRACQIKELKELTGGSKITLIEDTCKAMFSKTPQGYLGTLGDMGCFSLGMVSLISTGYGGLVITNREEIYEKLVIIRNQGLPAKGEEQYLALSFNFKLSDILAAIGIGQLSRLNEKLEHVNRVYKRYADGLSSLPYIQVIPVDVTSGKVPLCAEFRSAQREQLIAYLEANDVEPLRFHLPLHCAPYLNNSGDFTNASEFACEGFILPCGPSQPLENVDRCIELVQNYTKRLGR
jgi:perosamine synthetase